MKPLRWTRAALADLDRISGFIAVYDPPASRRVVAAIYASLLRVREFPLSAPLVPELGLRKLTVGRYPYVILYASTADRIEIARIHHAAEDWRPG